MTEKKIKMLVVDDHTVVRTGLKMLLNNDAQFEVIGEAADGIQALELCSRQHVDVVLLDLNMPKMTGQETLVKLKKLHPKVKVLVLTMYEDEEILLDLLNKGASGYILKKAPEQELIDAIKLVSQEEVYIDHYLTKKFVKAVLEPSDNRQGKQVKKRAAAGPGIDQLSKREVEVLKLVAVGHTDKEIAEKLYISVKTVESHKYRIKEKLNITRLAEMIRFAIEHGLLSTENIKD